MKLMSITLQRYKRFEEKTEIDVAGDVIALVGPNEAGKSSILDAMVTLNDTGPFAETEQTRDTDGLMYVSAGYILDESDRAALESIPGGAAVQWWTYDRWMNGDKHSRYAELHRCPMRDLGPRHADAAKLRAFAEKEAIHPRFGSTDGVVIQKAYDDALATLSSSDDSLNSKQINAIRLFANSMFKFGDICGEADPGSGQQRISNDFCDFLRHLSDFGEEQSPNDQAGDVLMSLRPKFLMFTAEDRDLRTTYELQEVVNSMPPALANLASLAQLDLQRLLDSVLSDRPDRREKMLDDANEILKEIFRMSWGQSDLTVRLTLSTTVLQILVSIPGGFSLFRERSAGLRSFVALRAFLAQHKTEVPPVLLVDEAETHLHYDAQADLIDLFSTQQLAAKVIYSTHSAGCLPRDLGNGIRVVAPIHGKERSTVKKSIWEGKEAGFTPLVFGMGATTFAFLPARNVLLAEGITDAMLYPTLMRESAALDVLPFQVAPGLSTVRPERMIDLTTEGASVLFLTDGDAAGKALRKELTDAGVDPTHVFGLDTEFGVELHLEDLIDPGVYIDAVNHVMQTFQTGAAKYRAADLPPVGRVSAIKVWCKGQGLAPPEKVDVAQCLLDMKAEAAREGNTVELVSASRKVGVADLCHSLMAKFPPLPKYSGGTL